MDIERLDATTVVLVLASERDGERLPDALHHAVRSLIAEGVTGLVVDLRAVTFLDSSGLGALVSCHAEVSGVEGARLVLTGVGTPLRRTLSRSMLLQVLPVYETVDRALAALRS